MPEASGNSDLDRLRGQIESAADSLPPDAQFRFRAMFGGVGVYAHERMFASLSHAGLALKLSPQDRATLLGEPGAAPLQYDPDGPVSKQYVVVPPAITADPALLAPWLSRSIAFTVTQPAAKPRRPK